MGLKRPAGLPWKFPPSKVLILSSYSDDQHVQQALDAGAAGYVMKETASQELLHAIREVGKGTAFFSPLIADAFVATVEKS